MAGGVVTPKGRPAGPSAERLTTSRQPLLPRGLDEDVFRRRAGRKRCERFGDRVIVRGRGVRTTPSQRRRSTHTRRRRHDGRLRSGLGLWALHGSVAASASRSASATRTCYPRIARLSGAAGRHLLPEVCGFPDRRGKCWWRLPCIHGNALLLVGGPDDGEGGRPDAPRRWRLAGRATSFGLGPALVAARYFR